AYEGQGRYHAKSLKGRERMSDLCPLVGCRVRGKTLANGLGSNERRNNWMLDTLWQDSRHAIRALMKDPGFAVVTAFSLALGIGANTAIFSLMDAVMLKTLPVSHPEELLQVTAGGAGGEYFSNPVWEQIRDRQDALSGIFAFCRWAFDLSSGGEA